MCVKPYGENKPVDKYMLGVKIDEISAHWAAELAHKQAHYALCAMSRTFFASVYGFKGNEEYRPESDTYLDKVKYEARIAFHYAEMALIKAENGQKMPEWALDPEYGMRNREDMIDHIRQGWPMRK